MAKYTIELGRLIKSGFDIGLADYPIFDENHRTDLNNKIIQHYYHSEIGLETPALFKRYLNNKMREIMPYYNKMYESETLEFNPLDTFNKEINETYTGNNTGTTEMHNSGTSSENGGNNSTATTTGTGKNVFSDTPQGLLANGDIDDEKYATNATIAGNTETETGANTFSNTANQSTNSMTTVNGQQHSGRVRTEKGKDGTQSYSKLLEEYRQTILNIDMMIIDELSPLFMGIW